MVSPIKGLQPGDTDKLRRLAHHEGWAVLERVLRSWQDAAARRLTDAEFTDLLHVGRLQGEITALRRVVAFVNNRSEQTEGD